MTTVSLDSIFVSLSLIVAGSTTKYFCFSRSSTGSKVSKSNTILTRKKTASRMNHFKVVNGLIGYIRIIIKIKMSYIILNKGSASPLFVTCIMFPNHSIILFYTSVHLESFCFNPQSLFSLPYHSMRYCAGPLG